MYKIVFITLACILIGCRPVNNSEKSAPPKLIVFISIDQFRFEYTTRFARYFGKDGFNYLLERGANFVNCQYEHAVTKTSVGHTVMTSGTFPRTNGIIANHWYDRELKRLVFSAEDTASAVLGLAQKSNLEGRSPKRLLVDNLGDILRQQTSLKSKVFGVSNKDYVAILMAGRSANAAYWMNDKQGGFFTSSYYMASYPSWVEHYNQERSFDKWIGSKWELLLPEESYPAPDTVVTSHYDYPKGWSGALPYVVGMGATEPDSEYYRLLLQTPFSSEALLDFTERLMAEEKLGSDEVPDILCISFSANDEIGHSFGPMSREVMDVTLRTDRYLARLFKFMDKTVGEDNILYVLTSDHGVAAIPEGQVKQGIDADRVKPSDIEKLVQESMSKKYGKLAKESSYVSRMANLDLYFNQAALNEKKIDKKAAEDYISEVLTKSVPQVFQVFTANSLKQGKIGQNKVSELVQNGYHARNSGDVIIILKPNYVWDRNDVGAEHGSPFSYDRHVPLMLAGPRWIKTGTFGKPCSPADIAPTLAGILGLDSTGFDGKILSEGIRFSK